MVWRMRKFDKRLIAVDASTGCWLWRGKLDKDGYGIKTFRVDGKRVALQAHRVWFEIWSGRKLPPDVVVRHSCDVRNCVNPQHLLIGTQADNVHDMVSRGRMYRGGMTRKLTREDVIAIRAALISGESKVSLSKAYGVSRRTIREIELREIWKDAA